LQKLWETKLGEQQPESQEEYKIQLIAEIIKKVDETVNDYSNYGHDWMYRFYFQTQLDIINRLFFETFKIKLDLKSKDSAFYGEKYKSYIRTFKDKIIDEIKYYRGQETDQFYKTVKGLIDKTHDYYAHIKLRALYELFNEIKEEIVSEAVKEIFTNTINSIDDKFYTGANHFSTQLKRINSLVDEINLRLL